MTPETFHALILSFKSLISFQYYLLIDHERLQINFQPGYLLTGKLQTDILEKRFGTYRQLNGTAYLMKLKELISGEKKLRIRTRIKLGNKKFIIDVNSDFEHNIKGDLIVDMDHIIQDLENVESMLHCDPKEMGAILYISGAIGYKLKKIHKCNDCCSTLIDKNNSYEIDNDCETDFFESINRGALIKPSLFLLSMVKICLNFFELYIRPALGMTIKNPSSSQLRDILYEFLLRIDHFENIQPCDKCESTREYLYKGGIRILSNIILNNFCKMTTDLTSAEKFNKSFKLKNQKQINITGFK